jgi:hypothetical protein
VFSVAFISLMGVMLAVMSIFMFAGWNDDFQAVAPDEGGRWRLTHLVRGTVARFSTADVEGITVDEVKLPDSLEPSWEVRVKLRDGRSFSLQTASMGTEATLKSLAETMELPPGVMHLRMPPGPEWVNQGRKVRLEDWVGTYRSTAAHGASTGSVLEFRIVNARLVGKETRRLGELPVTHELHDVRVTKDGEIEFDTESLTSAHRSGESFSFAFSGGVRQRAVLHDGFLDVDGTRYSRLDTPSQ